MFVDKSKIDETQLKILLGMPLVGDRNSSKTLISSGSQELFYSDVKATIAMLWRHGRFSIYRVRL